jgi:hypothetical protein
MKTTHVPVQIGLIGVALGLLCSGSAARSESSALIDRIKAVSSEGQGNEAAAKAWRELVRQGPGALLELLTALNDAKPIAANWLRSAVDAVAERALADNVALPAARLEQFVRDTSNAGPSRRLAYEWLARADSAIAERLLPGMLNDPGAELRRDAVARELAGARQLLERGDNAGASASLQALFKAARDRDQVEQIAKDLKSLNVAVDIRGHYGLITEWMLIGPFDNRGGQGFAEVFSPEKGVDLKAASKGKNGAEVHWFGYQAQDPLGLVDLNKAIGKNMGATAYAFATAIAPVECPVEIRAGSNNAVKMFLNGKLIYFREEYHHGMRMDQHTSTGTLKAGRNEILIKVCQNEQVDDWAQTWSFQLRVCDSLGGAVPMAVAAAGVNDVNDAAAPKKGQP